MSFREMRNTGLWIPGLILNSTLLPFIYFLGILFTPQFLPVGIFNTAIRLRARYRLSHSPRLDIPNIRSVTWVADKEDPNWVTSLTVKLLLGFSQLTDLFLMVDEEQDLSFLWNCLSKLHSLRKLWIEIRYWPGKLLRPRSSQINELGKVIGGNSHLTHLGLVQGYGAGGNLSKVFSYVPSEPPLVLEHLGISDTFLDPSAIVPHIRSLTSFSLNSCWSSRFLMVLLAEKIFPPVIRTSRVDDHLIDFLSCHPRITSLSLHSVYDEFAGRAILEIMARHARTLKYFSTSPLSFCRCLERDENVFSLLQCTNLEQVVLCYDYYIGTDVSVSSGLATALSIISRLSDSLTLAITEVMAFKACVKHCRQSWNPLVRNLAGRIVYEKA
ncbi:hypothetical protein AX15_001901 [Amanita polypyramis BW_CC]|nr:hypothetical protein AX15_001901 [Amanita polypyramis BW_CC]